MHSLAVLDSALLPKSTCSYRRKCDRTCERLVYKGALRRLPTPRVGRDYSVDQPAVQSGQSKRNRVHVFGQSHAEAKAPNSKTDNSWARKSRAPDSKGLGVGS